MRVGVDTGGTFTDLVADDGSVVKVLSTPPESQRAVVGSVEAVTGGADRPGLLAHGTTVATNALLEHRGGPVALVTNEGLGDVIEIARQTRPSLYDPFADRPEPLVPRGRRIEIRGRLDATGAELEPVDVCGLDDVDLADAASVAVCLLHADLDSAHEHAVADALRGKGLDVTCSHEVSPQFREYERTVTTVTNAFLRPVCRTYLHGLSEIAGEVLVMTSAGGLVPIAAAMDVPVTLLLSGPAGGAQAAAAIAAASGFPDAVSFDMGGTSTDVCLVLDGRPEPAGDRIVGGLPIRTPSLDIHTIGAGGGSIARVDPGSALVVGPQSAGADPGPVCYGRGGTAPTVTDANLVSGHIPADQAFAGLGGLDADAARRVFRDTGIDPGGVLRVVDTVMERALRTVTVARGVDPRRLALVAFGGAGPLHACGLADALGISTVIVPPRAGVFSAVGMLAAPRQHDIVQSWPTPRDHAGLDATLVALAADARNAVVAAGDRKEDVVVTTAVECRYEGQSHELRVPTVADFPAEHRRRNGYDRPGQPVEVVGLRATARRAAPVAVTDLPPLARRHVVGPAVITEPDCTVLVPAGWRGEPNDLGALLLQRTP